MKSARTPPVSGWLCAQVRVVFDKEPPRQGGRLGNSNPWALGNPGGGYRRAEREEVALKEINTVTGPVNAEGLGQFSGAGAEEPEIV